MRNFGFQSKKASPHGKILDEVHYESKQAKTLGGVIITRRLDTSVHPNPFFFTDPAAQKSNPAFFQSKSQKDSSWDLKRGPTHDTSRLSSHFSF